MGWGRGLGRGVNEEEKRREVERETCFLIFM